MVDDDIDGDCLSDTDEIWWTTDPNKDGDKYDYFQELFGIAASAHYGVTEDGLI